MDKFFIKLKKDYQERLHLNDDRFEDFIIDIYRRCYKKATNSDDLKRMVIDMINDSITSKSVVNKVCVAENFFDAVSLYIDDNLELCNGIVSNINQLLKISILMKEYGINRYDVVFCNQLLRKSTTFSSIMSAIVDNNPNIVDKDYIYDISMGNRNISNFILSYCKLKGIMVTDSDLLSNYSNIAGDTFDSTKIYFEEIKKCKRLKRNEFLSLIMSYKNGNRDALKKIVESNLGLVVDVLNKNFYYKDYDMLDLIQVGNIGLIKAVEQFDIKNGSEFSSYAYPKIYGQIARYINQNRTIRLSCHNMETYAKIKSTKTKFYRDYEREATYQELSEILNMKVERIRYVLASVVDTTMVSLNEPISSDDANDDLYQVVPNGVNVEDDVLTRIDYEDLYDAIEKAELNEIQRLTVLYRFGFIGDGDLSLEEIGVRISEDIGRDKAYSRQRISGVLRDALNKIRYAYSLSCGHNDKMKIMNNIINSNKIMK